MIHKPFIYFFDWISGMTFLTGLLTGQIILMLLGGLASLFAILNHGSDLYKKWFKKDYFNKRSV